jgi:hypothetical protein
LVATLREERRLRVFENRVLRGIFGPKRDEVRGEWIKLHNGEFHDLYFSLTQYCSGDQIERNERGGASSVYGERRGVYRRLVGKYEGKRLLGRPRRRWEVNIFRKWDVRARSGSIWIRTGTGGGHL